MVGRSVTGLPVVRTPQADCAGRHLRSRL